MAQHPTLFRKIHIGLWLVGWLVGLWNLRLLDPFVPNTNSNKLIHKYGVSRVYSQISGEALMET